MRSDNTTTFEEELLFKGVSNHLIPDPHPFDKIKAAPLRNKL